MLFGFVGKSRTGKTTGAWVLNDILGDTDVHEMSMPLKKVCSAVLGHDLMDLQNHEYKESRDEELKMTVRESINQMGAMFDAHFRDYFPQWSVNRPIWLREPNMASLHDRKGRNTVVTGIRTKIQAECVLRGGGVLLYMERTPQAGVVYSGTNHYIEQGVEQLRGLCHEVIDNNGSEEDLLKRLEEVVVKYSTPLN